MAAARKAIRAKQEGCQVIVVVSARGDTTDELIELARELSDAPPAREMDMLLSTGEQISIALMAMAIQALGERAISFTGAQVGIVTDSTHTRRASKAFPPPECARRWPTVKSSSWPAFRVWTNTPTSPLSAAEAPTLRPSPSLRP